MYVHATLADTDVPDYGRRGSPPSAGSGNGPGTDLTGKLPFAGTSALGGGLVSRPPNLPHNATHPMPVFKEIADV